MIIYLLVGLIVVDNVLEIIPVVVTAVAPVVVSSVVNIVVVTALVVMANINVHKEKCVRSYLYKFLDKFSLLIIIQLIRGISLG